MTALFFPTMVSGVETAMLVVAPGDGEVGVPLTSMTGLEPVFASETPSGSEHTGADELPVPVLSEHVDVPLVPTYTVSASIAQWPSVMQTPGPISEHSLSVAQARQVFCGVVAPAEIWQTGFGPEQVVLSVHWTQAPLEAQAVCPVKPVQSAAVAHPRHVLVAIAQMGVAPEQVAFVRHWTHLLLVVLQTLVAPMHLVLFVAVHCTQAPVAAQAARAGSLKAKHSVSAAHAWHLSVVPQMGVAPEQVAAEVHCTQALFLVSQTEVVPMQEALDLAVH